jgi:hypothetical protein
MFLFSGKIACAVQNYALYAVVLKLRLIQNAMVAITTLLMILIQLKTSVL